MRERDSAAAWRRRTRAQRRVGVGAACASCGERRPFALISGSVPPRCYACDRIAHGRPPYEDEHPFLRRNSDLNFPVPINDHRAVLSVRQYEWPRKTRENPTATHSSPRRRVTAVFIMTASTCSRASSPC
jgi:hypothetical protein